ncbi:MAG: hypothetical protein Q8L15_03185 [Methylobacter sp.]|nr:hypothetical protein [Methylobacter sp.]
MYTTRIINIFAIAFLIGCATDRNIATQPEDEFYSNASGIGESIRDFGQDDDLESKNYAVVKTFFATDRNLTGKFKKPSEVFGSDRSAVGWVEHRETQI